MLSLCVILYQSSLIVAFYIPVSAVCSSSLMVLAGAIRTTWTYSWTVKCHHSTSAVFIIGHSNRLACVSELDPHLWKGIQCYRLNQDRRVSCSLGNDCDIVDTLGPVFKEQWTVLYFSPPACLFTCTPPCILFCLLQCWHLQQFHSHYQYLISGWFLFQNTLLWNNFLSTKFPTKPMKNGSNCINSNEDFFL